MKTKHGIRWQISLIVTLVLILLMIAGSFIASNQINDMEEQRSFETLYQEAKSLVQEIETRAGSDREQLEMLSAVAASFPDLRDPELWEILDSYTTVGMMSDLSLLLPDGTVILSGSEELDASAVLSFGDIAAQGAHITDRETSLITGGYILRHYVPVVQNGEITAMLYGIVDLDTLPEDLFFSPYGGRAALYIIDGATGDFLLDTWHAGSEPGNIWALGERAMAPGYDHEQHQAGLINGTSDYVVFVSNTTGEYLYFYYTPLNINQWRLALSVPEDLVFSSATLIRNVLNLFLVFEAVCFILYFLWMLRYVRRETGEKQRQLDTINNIYDVEKLLFNAHEHQENIAPALEKVAHNTGSSAVSLWVMGLGEAPGAFFAWSASGEGLPTGPAGTEAPEYIDRLLKLFQDGQSHFEAYDVAGLSPLFPGGVPGNITGLAAIPLEDMNESLCGILTVINPRRGHATPALLRSVGFSFSMLCRNMRSYNAIRAQGETDALTGLLNRNRYERDLPGYRQWYRTSLACVYIDANGLHELNNTLGHEAGDTLLRRIAAEIRRRFGKTHSYRIGGDEFLIFVPDMTEATVSHLCMELEEALLAEGIHISAGIQWSDTISDLTAFIQAAEGKMYAAKRAYYANRNLDHRQRYPSAVQ